MNIRNFVLIGLGCAGLVLAGWLYYLHVPKPPPAPKDLTKILPQQLLQKASAADLAVLRGVAPAPRQTVAAGNGAPAPADTTTAPGLTLTLASRDAASLQATAVNATDTALTWSCPAGTLFSNGSGDVVLLRDVSMHVPAKASAQALLAVAQTKSEDGELTGTFTRSPGSIPALQPLLKVIASHPSVSAGAMQTAVLAVSENIPLDDVSAFPRTLRPPSLPNNDPQPFRVSTADIMTALSLLQQAGLDTRKMAMAGDPALKIMAMLDPRSHAEAKAFFGISDQAEWGFWRHQLLSGDPTLRHYALYGIARYYPDVAIQMMPNWIRTASVSRSYRVSAAWALALIDDPRARRELTGLRQELDGDPGMRQALDRALRHWNAKGPALTAKAG